MMKRGDTFWESDKKQSIGGNEMNYDSDKKPVLKIGMPGIVEFYDKHHRNMILFPCIISLLCKFWIMQMKLKETPYTISELMSVFEYGKAGKVIFALRCCDYLMSAILLMMGILAWIYISYGIFFCKRYHCEFSCGSAWVIAPWFITVYALQLSCLSDTDITVQILVISLLGMLAIRSVFVNFVWKIYIKIQEYRALLYFLKDAPEEEYTAMKASMILIGTNKRTMKMIEEKRKKLYHPENKAVKCENIS